MSAPDRPDAEGTDDRGLQPERTSLAWRRAGLALTAVATAMARVAMARDALPIAALAGALAVVALGALLEGSIGHGPRRRWFEDDRSLTGLSLVARSTVATAIVLSVTGLLLVLTT